LRILAFSDWRSQDIDLPLDVARELAPLDLIAYAGDDVIRLGAMRTDAGGIEDRVKIQGDLELADVLRHELEAYEVKLTPGGGDVYAAGREGKWDDLVFAVMPGCGHWNGYPEPRIIAAEPLSGTFRGSCE